MVLEMLTVRACSWKTGAVPAVVGVEVYPPEAVLDGVGATQQLTVLAKYADGTDRDVTKIASFVSNNDVSAKITKTGLVTADKRGEAFVMARFDAFTVGAQVLVIPKGRTQSDTCFVSFQCRSL